MKTNADMTHTQKLTRHILAFTNEDIPASAYDAATRLLLDTLGCALAGRRAPGVEAVIEQMRDWGGKPEASLLFGEPGKLPMPNAAFANSALIHAQDLDDVFTPGTALHLTSVIVPVMLAAAEASEASGREALAAMILGIETAARIGVVGSSRQRSGGFLPSTLVGSFGAVVTAARLLGLSHEQTVHALGINYAQISGNRQALLDASLTKRLQPACAARSALWATALAARGITGPQRVSEGEAGYFTLYMNGEIPDAAEFLKPFDAFAIEYVSTKRYPSCGACHSVQIAAERLREEEHLEPANIARVESFGIAPLVAEPFDLRDNPQVAAQFSGAWAVAHTLLRGPATLADYTDAAVRNDREVCELTRAIKPVPAPADLPPPPELHPLLEGQDAKARRQGVIVYTRDGRRLMRSQAPCETFPLHPAPWAETEAKFNDCAAFANLAPAQAAVLITQVKSIEVADTVRFRVPNDEQPEKEHENGYY
ncbi:MAG: MmgE/PrpD family protein [Candidatus Marinimicrobia bacterium]|nr:MmgE/PrpD family protein [Candidatus Neomarinimicrobiota bacterium]